MRDQLQQILKSNEAARSKILAIVKEMKENSAKIKADPQLANDPIALKSFQSYVDVKLAEIQDILVSSQVDAKQQAELLAALADEYDGHTPKGTKGDPNGSGAGPAPPGGADPAPGGGAGGPGGGGGADPAAGAPMPDPLAGTAGLPMGAGLGDPLSMLGPALGGLGAIPGALGGAAGSLPTDALSGLSALAPLASGLAAGHDRDGFNDHDPEGRHNHDRFTDDHSNDNRDKGDEENKPKAKPAGAVEPADGPTPAAAAPAAGPAPANAALVVQMPDGSPVTAPSAQHAAAMRSVLAGGSVTDAWKGAHVELPPPGTPITSPADPAHLPPGAVAHFKSRDPVMYMGNGKIWLDGQLQPLRALPTADFLAWSDPAPQAAAAPAPPGPPAAAAAASSVKVGV